MTKQENISNPNSCWNKAALEEQIFVLRAKDKAMADTLRFWAKKRVELGLNQPTDLQILSAIDLADGLDDGINT